MMPPRPGAFSITTGWCQRSPSFSAIRRLMESGLLAVPAATMILTGLSGYPGAPDCAAAALPAASARPAQASVISLLNMRGLLIVVMGIQESNVIPKSPDLSQEAALLFHSVNFRSEEHTSELQALMRISYAGF